MELKENERLVHIFKYGDKEIPVYYNIEKIKDRLEEVEKVIEILKRKNISFSVDENKLLLAEESILSSYIEGYESGLTAKFVVDGIIYNDLGSRAVKSGYKGYLKSKNIMESNISFLSTEVILSIWRELVSYKRLFRKNIRLTGVKVGNHLTISHVAPPAIYVKQLLNDMFYSLNILLQKDENALLTSIIFHYLFTFIHPFLDGNGRISRLIEQSLIMQKSGLSFYPLISDSILYNKKKYYNVFKSGQSFGDSHLDVLSIDITDFINFNLYTIEQGFLESLRFISKNISFNEGYKFKISLMGNLFNHLGQFDRVGLKKYLNDLNLYCELLLDGVIEEKEYNSKLHLVIEDVEKYHRMIEEKWVEVHQNE